MPLLHIIAFLLIGALLFSIFLKVVVPFGLVILALLCFGSFNVPSFRLDRMWHLLTKAKARRSMTLAKMTAQLLEEKGKKVDLGSVTVDGFYLDGKISKKSLGETASEAVEALKSRKGLTTETSSALVSALTSALITLILVVVLLAMGNFSLLTFVLAVVASISLGSPLSPKVETLLLDRNMTDLTVEDVISCDAEEGSLSRWIRFSDTGFFVAISHGEVEDEDEE